MKKSVNYGLLGLGLLVWFFAHSCSQMMAKALDLGARENKVVVEKNVMVEMRDGLRLATDIYKPRPPGKYPVVLCRVPYGKNHLGEIGRLFAQRGYIFVIQDCRATFDSEGEVFIPFVYDREDGRDTGKWISAQSWFNGSLASWGASYFGYTQWVIADENPYLKCFYPQITSANMYSAIFTGGAFHYRLTTGWSAGVGKQNQKSGLISLIGIGKKKVKPEEGLFNKPLKPALGYSFEELGKMEIEELAVVLGLAPEESPREPYPDATEKLINLFAYPGFAYHSGVFNYFDRYKKVSAPGLLISGWYDIFLKGQLDDFVQMKKLAQEPARSQTRLLIGPWAHASIGYPDAGEQAKAMEMYKKMFMIDWFDYWMKGEDNQVASMPLIKIYVMGKNIWREEQEWPLAGTRWTEYYFRSKGNANTAQGDGWLSIERPAKSEITDEFSYDPKKPAPTVGGNNLLENFGAKDQSILEKREDVLVYSSEPLKEELEITGPIKVILFASSSAKDTDFTAKLCAVKKNGASLNLADGIVRARYRTGYDKPSLIEPQKIYQYEIDLWATSYAFQPGERIRVQLSSSNFPKYDRNSNCAGEGGENCTKKAHQIIYHNKDYPSRIILPVIPSE